MITLTCEKILKLAPKYDIIPVCREIYTDAITPITLLRRIVRQSKRFFLLESTEGGERWGRYSSLGYDPVMCVTCKSGSVAIESSLREIPPRTLTSDQPLWAIREILSRFKSSSPESQPSFTGGFTGRFVYAMVEHAEPVLHISRGSVNDLDSMPPDKVIAYDHLKQKIEIIVSMRTGRIADPDPRLREIQYPGYLMREYGRVCGETEAITSLANQPSLLEEMTSLDKPVFTCNVSRETFCHTVEKTKEHILDGDISQAAVSRQFTSPYKGSLLVAYRVPRTINPSPYIVYMNIDNDEITNTSPETLIRLKDGHLTTFPVVGSGPRGVTLEEDGQPERELLKDEKELPEHNVLVDLGRNDIGKIVALDSVEVTEYKMMHRYLKIMHICSQVEGGIRPGLDGCSAIEALLPAGTLSGVSKIRACRIIEELEQVPRGIYGGALGYLNFTGSLDTRIAIRMAVKQGGKVIVQAGGGIVMDSVSENKYEESVNKARVVINAIINVGEVNDK